LTNPIQDIGRRTLWIAVAVIALACVLLVGFPAERFTIEPGLDPSWTYGINLAANQGLVFIGDNLTKAIVFQLSLRAVLAVLLISIVVKTKRVAPLVVWAFGFSTALAVGLQYEYQMIGVAALRRAPRFTALKNAGCSSRREHFRRSSFSFARGRVFWP
jgi:hypothetical protein